MSVAVNAIIENNTGLDLKLSDDMHVHVRHATAC